MKNDLWCQLIVVKKAFLCPRLLLACLIYKTLIHVKERNAIFPFPESCPFFSESERKAGLIWKGRKGTGKERYDGAKFPFLSISDFPI